MQRILTALLCLGGCSYAGLRLADRLRCRASQLRALHAGLNALTSAVAYTNRPLAKIAGDIAGREGSAFWRQFSERLASGMDAGDAWLRALESASMGGGPLSALTQRDRALIVSFSATLEKTDRRSLAENGRMTLEALSTLIAGADAVYAKKGRVYRVLGVFLGLGVGVLFW